MIETIGHFIEIELNLPIKIYKNYMHPFMSS